MWILEYIEITEMFLFWNAICEQYLKKLSIILYLRQENKK